LRWRCGTPGAAARTSPTALAPAEPMNDEAVDRLMREMAPPDTGDGAAPPEEK